MTISDFLKTLYPFYSNGDITSYFTETVFGMTCKEGAENPLYGKTDLTQKIFNGRRLLSNKAATIFIKNADKSKFENFLKTINKFQIESILESFKPFITFTEDNFFSECANTFLKLIYDVASLEKKNTVKEINKKAQIFKLLSEVSCKCPICNIFFLDDDKENYTLTFIYPTSPKSNNLPILNQINNKPKDLYANENVIPLCKDCNYNYISDFSLNSYENLSFLKAKISERFKIKNKISQVHLDKKALIIIENLSQVTYLNISSEKIDSFNIRKDFSIENILLENEIKAYIEGTFNYIDKLFKDNDLNHKLIFSQINYCFKLLLQENLPFDIIYDYLVGWINEKTFFTSKFACKAFISYLIQKKDLY